MKFLKWLRGEFPDITPAQIIAGIPLIAEALHAFGVYDLSLVQQQSLTKMVTWAIGLLGADAAIRIGRNVRAGLAGRGTDLPLAPAMTVDRYGSVFSSAVPTGWQEAQLGAGDDEEPGDDDLFPDLPVADPSELPEDEGEDPAEVEALLAAIRADGGRAPLGASVSGLNPAHRVAVRRAVKRALDLAVKHSGSIDYTQGPRRWEWKRLGLFASKGLYPKDTDCSGFATWALYQGLRLFHLRDVVNGQSWLAGFTGTMLRHGRVVVHEGNIQLGDLAIYGVPGTTGAHVAVCIGGGYVLSHGSPGVHKLPLHYRGDLIAVHRYI